ncbi:Hypothetical protein PENO1_094300 [Penicillium occitanis (nom. inval.)]|nr:Hypothetical protein PENO1_094300 [Penicillium occitanis (nom. inval.)]PCG91716.1 hypothetical protein PENOC_095960 [Penicillium occitanis (nom. inval.)]
MQKKEQQRTSRDQTSTRGFQSYGLEIFLTVLAFSEIADNDDIKTCITACPHNEDGHWAPDRILDFCQLVTGEDIQLPYYMDQYAGPHRREAIPVTDVQDEAIVYSDFSYYEPSATTFITTLEPSTATTTKPTITSAPTTSVSASSLSSSSSQSGGLSTGAKAGIGVAVPLVIIGILLGIFWYRRKQRGNKNNVRQRADGNNIPDMSKRMWSKNFFSTTFRSLPAEADSNPIHESDSNPVPSSRHLRGSDTTSPPIVYELSAQPSIRAPPAAVLASHRPGQSINEQVSEKNMPTSDRLCRTVVGSPVSLDDSETAPGKGPDTPPSYNLTTPAVVQHQYSNYNPEQNPSSSAETANSTDTELLNLEAEMARVREQRERLQHLQFLEEREEQLQKDIEARKSGLSKQA